MSTVVPDAVSPRIVRCPACGNAVAWTQENSYRPFCSKRCKSIDFGAWAAEEYRVPCRDEQEIQIPDFLAGEAE